MADIDLAELLAQRAALEQQIADRHDLVLAELVAAKEAARADPTETNRARRAAAVAQVQQLRAALREGRTVPQVGGDAFVSSSSNSTVEG